MTIDKLYDDLERRRRDFIVLLMKWANLDPRTIDNYDTKSAFSFIHENSQDGAATRFIYDALEMLEQYRIAAQPYKDSDHIPDVTKMVGNPYCIHGIYSGNGEQCPKCWESLNQTKT